MLASLGKMPTTSARRFTSLFSRSNGLVVQLGAVLGREGHVGQHVVLAVVHQRRRAWASVAAELIGDMPPGLMRGLGIGLQESLADRGGDHGVLAFRHMRQGVAHPMHAAPLPGRTEHPGDRVAQAVMSVGDRPA